MAKVKKSKSLKKTSEELFLETVNSSKRPVLTKEYAIESGLKASLIWACITCYGWVRRQNIPISVRKEVMWKNAEILAEVFRLQSDVAYGMLITQWLEIQQSHILES